LAVADTTLTAPDTPENLQRERRMGLLRRKIGSSPRGLILIYVRIEFGAAEAVKVTVELELAGPPSRDASRAGA
jgi:hypothetical protein